MESLEVLENSLELLIQKPTIFMPRIASSILSSLFFLVFLGEATTGISNRFMISSLIGFYILSIVGIFVWLMVASMVKNREKGTLKRGFTEAGSKLGSVIKLATAIYILGFIIALPSSVGIVLFSEGLTSAIIIGPLLTILLIFLVSYTSYFVPVTLLEADGVLEGWKKSYSSSRENSSTVVLLTVLSFLLLGISFTFSYSEFLNFLGQAGFVISRIVSTVVSTYVLVLSPELYID